MSNNKQSIKIYTQEQVRSMLEVCLLSDLYEHITLNDILKTQTPIQLPSDEEIEKEIYSNMDVINDEDFRIGVKWMRDKIQGGNK